MHKKWSHSALNDYQKCGHYFYLKHIIKRKAPGNPPATRGIAVHRQAEGSFRQKMDIGESYTVEKAKDEGATHFEEIWERYGTEPDKGEVKELGSPGAVKAAYKDETVNLSGAHAKVLAPAIDPITVEEKVIMKPRDRDYRISVIVDLVERRPQPTPFPDALRASVEGTDPLPENAAPSVAPSESGGAQPGLHDTVPISYVQVARDLKTTRKAPNKDEAEKSQQLSFQALGWLAKTGHLPHGLSLDYLWQTPAKKELKKKTLDTERTKEDINRLLVRVDRTVDATAKGVFLPTQPDHWFCSPKFCPYFEECPYTKNPVQIGV